MHEQRQYSEETAHIIDQEMRRFLSDAAGRAGELLQHNRNKLDTLARGLLEKEMLGREDLEELIGSPVPRQFGTTKI
jgi:cell division protease FtsH